MIYFDVTKTALISHQSGLARVTNRLGEELGSDARKVRWSAWDGIVRAEDWFLTAELFTEEERPGFMEYLLRRPCRFAAIFHDAIPLKHPHITWPQSVARHPGYMKMLALFDRVWAVSEASRRELVDFWRWQGVEKVPPVEVLALGADFNHASRVTTTGRLSSPAFLCLGIIEPRKNQMFLLDVCEELWREGMDFTLHVVGRVNPHFGSPIVARMKSMQRHFPGLQYHRAAADDEVATLYTAARASVLPTIAEGCGLPLLESLWMGVPCVCSDLPVLRENAGAGGCVVVEVSNRAAWKTALRRVLTDDTVHSGLVREATSRPLPSWAETGRALARAMNPAS